MKSYFDLKSKGNPTAQGWFWAFAAFLFASARLFEQGLSLDPAIYSTMARNFAESGGWRIGVGKYFFQDFPDHPYLFAWLQGLFFRAFGASDFTARVPSLVMGCLTLYFFHQFLYRNFGEKRANLFCLLTVLSPPFVGRFATPYLEISYFFFFVVSLDYLDRSLQSGRISQLLVSALLFVGAFFTKGIALLPALALLGYWSCFGVDPKSRSVKWFLFWLLVTVITGTALIGVQTHFSEFPFWREYFYRAFFKRATQSHNLLEGEISFFLLIFKLHPLHSFLALAGFGWGLKKRDERSLLTFGSAGLILFGAANGVLGKGYHHYTYPTFPFVNFLAVVGLSQWAVAQRWRPETVRQWALRLGLFYQLLWNLLPIPLRRKPYVDFFQFRPKIAAMKNSGLKELQGLNLSDTDWLYPAVSLWYWQADTRLIESVKLLEKGALLTEVTKTSDELRSSLRQQGFTLCDSADHYLLWTVEEYRIPCLQAHRKVWP